MLATESVIALSTLKKFVKHLPRNFVAGESTKRIADVIEHRTQYYKRVQICKDLVHSYEKDCELRILEANNIGAFYRSLIKG